jgi:hypothetical protein
MMKAWQESYPERRKMLIDMLGVNLDWRMHQVSDGQRRRVQIFLQLLRPVELLLLDEITTDLDVITRADFLEFLKKESEEHGTTIVYATHIFDGLAEVSVMASPALPLASGVVRSGLLTLPLWMGGGSFGTTTGTSATTFRQGSRPGTPHRSCEPLRGGCERSRTSVALPVRSMTTRRQQWPGPAMPVRTPRPCQRVSGMAGWQAE